MSKPDPNAARSCAGLIDGRAISRFGNRLLFNARNCQPGSFRDFRLLERFGGSLSKRRTGIEVGNVGDVPAVCFAMVVLHGYSRLIALSARPPLESFPLSILVMHGLPVREKNGLYVA